MDQLVALFDPSNPIYQLIVALLLGGFIGLRREIDAQEHKKESFMGFRTMALISMLGAISTFFPTMPYLPAVTFVGLLSFVAIAYAHGNFKLNLIGMTSEIVALIMFWIGVLVGFEQQVVAIILAIVIGSLNAFKDELHLFARTFTTKEWSGALQLLAISAAMLPFLPREPIDPWGVFVPFNIWFLVVLISGIGFLGYFLTKFFGVKGGIPLTAFLGSIVSSTAVTTSMADQSKRLKLTGIFTVGVMIAHATMQLRVAAEIWLWGQGILGHKILLIPLSMFVTALICAVYFWWRTIRNHEFATKGTKVSSKVELQSPFEIIPALKFGGIFLVVLFGLALGQKYLGDYGVYAAAFLSGFVDVDAIVLSSLESAKLGELNKQVAFNAIVLAIFINTLVKILYVYLLGPKKMFRKVAIGTLLTVATGLIVFMLI